MSTEKLLFLGLGKVNLSLSSVIEGDALAFVEEEGRVHISERSPDGRFLPVQSIQGSLDTIDWKTYLPAKVFISPGIDPRRSFFAKLSSYEINELDYVSSRFKNPILAVTGTDGKSTFTTQLGEVMRRLMPEKKIFVGGNLGLAMGESLKANYDLSILEVSSFQAERSKTARPLAAIILNLDVDHLDRYDSLEDYFKAKWNLVSLAQWAAYPEGLQPLLPVSESICKFSNSESLSRILELFVKALCDRLDLSLHAEVFEDLPRLEHRLEEVKTSGPGLFVNDSKATTVHAALYGLKEMQARALKVKLILGGHYKGDDFRKIPQALRPADELLICGEARDIIAQHTQSIKARRIYKNLQELLDMEVAQVKAGECLLLSPACSSYDEFDNFEERGRYFKSRIRELLG